MKTRRSITGLVKTATFFALLAVLLVSGADRAGAEPKKDVSAPGTGQVLLCQGFGGRATVGEVRTPGGGLTSTTVSCSGGMMDGMSCTNNQSGTNCSSSRTYSPDGPSAEDVEAGNVVLSDYLAVEESGPVVEQTPAVSGKSSTNGSLLQPLPSGN